MGKNVLINEDSLKDLANALRGKSGSSEKFKVKNMDDFVESLNIAPEGTKIVDEDTIVLDPDEVEIAETSYDVDPMQMSVTAYQQDVEAVSVVSNETLIKANASISTRISNGEIVNAINNFGPESVIIPENIKRDVNILGITGTLEAEPEDLTDAISITENILGREEPEKYEYLFGSYSVNVNNIDGQQVGTLDFNNVTFYRKGGANYIQYEAENNTDYTFDENPYFIGSDFYSELYLDTSAGETHVASLSYPYPYNPHVPHTMEASSYIDLSTLSPEEIENNIRIEYSANVDMQENQPQPVERGGIQATIYLGSEGEEETHVDASSVTVINSNSGEDITSQINFQAYDGINNVSELPLNTDLEITWHLNNEDYNDVTSAHYLTSSETEYITLVSQQKVEPDYSSIGQTIFEAAMSGLTSDSQTSFNSPIHARMNLSPDIRISEEESRLLNTYGVRCATSVDYEDPRMDASGEHISFSLPSNNNKYMDLSLYFLDNGNYIDINNQVWKVWVSDTGDMMDTHISYDLEDINNAMDLQNNYINNYSSIGYFEITGLHHNTIDKSTDEGTYQLLNSCITLAKILRLEIIEDPEPEYEEKEISFNGTAGLTCTDGKMRYYPGEDKLIFEVTVTNNTPEDIDIPEGKLEGGAYGGTVNSLEFNTKERFNPDDSEVITATCLKDENGHISLNTSDGDINYSSYLDAFDQVTNIYLALRV